MSGRIYAREDARTAGIGDFGGRVRMEVLDLLGMEGRGFSITVVEAEGEPEIDMHFTAVDARRMLRACLAALEADEDTDS